MRNLIKNKKKKGFTLIEMVAVVAIIGILAAILIPKVTGYMNEAKKTKVIDQARKVVQAVESTKLKNSSASGIGSDLENITNVTVIELLGGTTEANVGLLTGSGKLLPNLNSKMKLSACEHIAKGGDFTLSGDKFSATR